jgi:leader peptidase (prepilin peptidase)/N-methyltransferase
MAITPEAWLMLAAAPFIGSFLGVLIRRLPQGAPVLWVRSACPGCQTPLAPRDLVPLLSFVAQRGRCRHCLKRIAAFHWWIELAALGVAAWAVTAGRPDTLVADCVLGWTLLALAWIDAETMLLPDVLTLPLLLAGFAEAWLLDPASLPDRAIGAGLGWGCFAGIGWLWRRWRGIDALGAGDAKLLAASGAWLGWQALPEVLVVAALAAIAATLARNGRHVAATHRLAFGPWLVLATWLARLYGGEA